jgi:hypothetical protein
MGPKGDAGQHQAGDKSGDTHRSGDGPVKISEVPGPRNADGPRHGGHQPPGPQLSTNPAQWKAQFESHWVAPHPERAMVPATEIKHRVELPPIGFTHTLDLNKCRDKNGNLDLTKLQAASRRIVKTDVGMAQPERPRPGHPPPAGVGNRELRVQPVDITLHLMNKKSDSETVLVRAVFHEVAKTVTNWDVRTHVDPPSPLRPDPPGPKPGPEPRPGPRMPRPGTDHPQPRSDHVEIHQPGQAPRQVPPVRQMPHVQPHTPWR